MRGRRARGAEGALDAQLDALVQARLLQGEADALRLKARRRLHVSVGKEGVFAKAAAGGLALDPDALARELRGLTAREERLDRAVAELAHAEPRALAHAVERRPMRGVDARRGAARHGGGGGGGAGGGGSGGGGGGGGAWLGAAEPVAWGGGGLAMAIQLLATRHERTSEAMREEEAQQASKEKLLAQLAECHGAIKGVKMLQGLRDDGADAALRAAREQLPELSRDLEVGGRLTAKYEAQRLELERADHDFEQAYGAAWLLDCALAALLTEQAAVLDAVRLQAFARARHYDVARQSLHAHRRWFRELAAYEAAFEELRSAPTARATSRSSR